MCKPLGNAEKAVIAALNELDPNMIVMLFTEVMIDGDCQVVKHIAETHLDAFPGELQTKVAMIGKLVDLVDELADPDEALEAAMPRLKRWIDAEFNARPVPVKHTIGDDVVHDVR